MSLTPGKPNRLSPKPLSGRSPTDLSSGGSKSLSPGGPKPLSPGGPKSLSTGGPKSLSLGGSKDLSSGGPKSLSLGGSKDLSSGGPKSLAGFSSNPTAGQNGTQPTQSLFPGLGKGALSLSIRGNKGNPPSQDSKPNSNIVSTALAIRPGIGNAGNQIHVETNHFKLDVTKVDDIYLHSVSITAGYERRIGKKDNGEYNTEKVDVTPKKIRRILAQLLENNPSEFQMAATDYAGKLVSLNSIVPDLTLKVYEIEYYEVDERAPAHGVSKRPFKVCVQHFKTVKASVYLKNLAQTGNPAINDDKIAILDALNLMISRYPSEHAGKVIVGGTRHFNTVSPPEDYENLCQGLRAWAGYERSVRGSSEGLLLQINCAVSAFYAASGTTGHPGDYNTLDYLIHEWSIWDSGKHPNQEYKAKEEYQDRNYPALERFIKGMRVTTTYGANLPYTVCSLAEPSIPGKSRPIPGNVKFTKKFPKVKDDQKTIGNGPWKKTLSSSGLVMKPSTGKDVANPGDDDFDERLISVEDHLHSLSPPVKITYHTGLVINVGSKTRPVYIPAEFLRFEPGISFRRPLNPDQTQKMVRFASMAPKKTKDMIASEGLQMFGIQKMQQGTSPAPRFGMMVTTSMLSIKARILQRPTLMYRTKALSLPNNTGQWLLKNLSLHKVVQKPTWALVQFRDVAGGGWCDSKALDVFHKELTAKLWEYCSAAGTEVVLKEQGYTLRGRSTVRTDLEKMFENVAAENERRVMTPKISVVFVILPSKSAVIYETLKHLAETKYGLHTICTVRQGPGLKSKADFFTNLMLKCNLKMGGSNTTLEMEKVKGVDSDIKTLIIGTNTMIVGADVTHAGAGSKMGSPSIAAVVASRDDDFQQYPARLRCQWNHTEIIEDLEGMMVEHLHAYAAKNKGTFPKQIIFYRDGVSEGEFKTVRAIEHAGIVRAFAKVYKAKNSYPKLLLLCVVKRSSARFYPQSNQADPKGNSWPGLVVDTAVTSTTYYDFYLQSHKSLQGTAKPAHYVVLIDEINISPDTLQKLTYWQCYTFGRSLQAIAAHPAARLADRACARGRAYLREFLIDESRNDSGSSMKKDEKMQQVYDAAIKAWGAGVHKGLVETMYYI